MAKRLLAIAEDYRADSLRGDFIDRAQAADRAGVNMIFVTESVGHDAFIVLSEIARRTSQTKLCTRIASVWDRTPTALARAFKSLDVLSGGRAVMGIGAGDASITQPAFGMPYERPAKRLREYASVLPALVASEPVSFRGDIVNIDLPAGLRFPPVQKKVPLWVAASGQMNLRTVAQYADGWLTYLLPFSALPFAIKSIRKLTADAGRDPNAVAVQSSGVIVAKGPSTEVAKRRVRRIIAEWVVHGGFGLRELLCNQGYEDVVQEILQAKDSGNPAEAAVPESMQQDLIFVGETDACIERLDAERHAGAVLHQADVQTDDLSEFERELGRLVG
jgi:5,10-methylenetetrahydromethanopterin reductase/phthiodiolone/phenolphthiodiolone dimycocerosates ketoreductase